MYSKVELVRLSARIGRCLPPQLRFWNSDCTLPLNRLVPLRVMALTTPPVEPPNSAA